MEIIELNNKVKITGISDFILDKTFECGQCFRWNADENGIYTGVAHGSALKIQKDRDSILLSCNINNFEAIWRNYFDFDRDYSKIRELLCIDDFMRRATSFGEGIRILRQDKWEALCSFIISQNNNIPRIKTIINKLCSMFGDIVEIEGEQFYTFPTAACLSGLSIEDLSDLRCGYRAEYIICAANAVAGGKIDLDGITRGSPEETRFELKKLKGVGNKVADCFMLFGLHMLDVFPVDVWMKRAVAINYSPDFDPGIFSPYAGIAQQYMFYYLRENHQKYADSTS